MQYEPLKHRIDRFISGSQFLKKLFFRLIDLYLLRTRHVHREIKKHREYLIGNKSVLDAGCGFGQYSWYLLRKFRNIKITGVDISEKHIEKARSFFEREGFKEAAFEQADLSIYRKDDAYDFIISVDVMEHILDDQSVFNNFYYSLRSNGMLMVSTPSDQGGSGVHDHHEDESFIDEHVRDGYSVDDITDKLTKAGFYKVNVKYTYGNPGKISWILQMKIPITLLNKSRVFSIILLLYIPIIILPCFLLNYLDIIMTHKSGTGLLVTAFKN